MSLGYNNISWEDFFVCTGGATAVPSGLIFVALKQTNCARCQQ
jgi:hypothetical protein